MPELHGIVVLSWRYRVEQALQDIESRAFVLEIGRELQQHAAHQTGLGQGLNAGLLKRGGPEDGFIQISIDQGLVGDQLGHLHRVLETFWGLLDPCLDLELARRPVEGAVDLYSIEVPCIIGKPLALLLGKLYRIESAYPVIVGPAGSANQDSHYRRLCNVRRDI